MKECCLRMIVHSIIGDLRDLQDDEVMSYMKDAILGMVSVDFFCVCQTKLRLEVQ